MTMRAAPRFSQAFQCRNVIGGKIEDLSHSAPPTQWSLA